MHVCPNGLLRDAAVHHLSHKRSMSISSKACLKRKLAKIFRSIASLFRLFLFFDNFYSLLGTAVAQYDLRTVEIGGSNLGISKVVKAAAW